jgi:cell division protein FtsB
MSSAGAELGRRVRLGAPLLAIFLVVGLVGAMAITPTRELLAQRQRISSMANTLDQTRHSNVSLTRRIQRLKDPDYIEQQARSQIGLVRPGETQFVVMPPSRQAQAKHRHHLARLAAAKKMAQRHARPKGFLQGLLHFIGVG